MFNSQLVSKSIASEILMFSELSIKRDNFSSASGILFGLIRESFHCSMIIAQNSVALIIGFYFGASCGNIFFVRKLKHLIRNVELICTG